VSRVRDAFRSWVRWPGSADACANVANLIRSRSSCTRESWRRAALGASRRHIVGQMPAESLVPRLAARPRQPVGTTRWRVGA
jgi:hypothetical protein